MEKCLRCQRLIKDEGLQYCNECSAGVGKKPGQGTTGSPGRTAARRRRRRGD